MIKKKRHTVTTIESHEFWIVRKQAPAATILCGICPEAPEMLTAQRAAKQAGVTQRMVFRWVEDGLVHFAETETGELLVCLAPLSG
jgi:hypothetical protein